MTTRHRENVVWGHPCSTDHGLQITRWVSARAPCGARPVGTPAWARKHSEGRDDKMVSGTRDEPASRRRASETAKRYLSFLRPCTSEALMTSRERMVS